MTQVDILPTAWLANAQQLKTAGFTRCEWLTATHNGGPSFTVTLCVAKVDLSERTLFSCPVDAEIESLISVYPSVAFHEREVAQMFGLTFSGSGTSERAFETEFDGFPLRRDFALATRAGAEWPGAVEPDENAKRRPSLPPGVLPEWKS